MNLILMNGIIVSMDKLNPTAEALFIKGNIIVSIGTNSDVLKSRDINTEIIDLKGKLLVPGFIDSHLHLIDYGFSLCKVELSNCKNIDEIIEQTKRFIKENPPKKDQWILGGGWNQDNFKEMRFPTRYDLDKISLEYPICLTRSCLHIAVTNSKALEMCNISNETPQTNGGFFDTDDNGEPLGIFRENAKYLICNKINEPNIEEIKKNILRAVSNIIKKGITSVQTDDFEALPGKDFEKIIKAYIELNEIGNLSVRVYEQCLLTNSNRLNKFLKHGYRTGYGDDFFKIGPLKLLADGSLGARTAFLNKPYEDDILNYGIPVYTQSELDQLVITAHREGMQIAIHSIGDKTMYMALESLEKAFDLYPNKNHRAGLIHCQVTDNLLINKFKEMNIIIYIQPSFTCGGLHIAEKRLGKERSKTSYNWGNLFNNGIKIACSSDSPVMSFDVMLGIYAAVTRKDLDGYPEDGWLPDQKLTVYQALQGYTLNAAYASFEEKEKGSLEVGKLADMVVLSDNIFEIEPDKIKDVEVLITILDGEIKYCSDSFIEI